MLYLRQEFMCSRSVPDADDEVREGIQVLKAGGLVAFPTDTVYGLGCDAFNKQAVDRIFDLKKRDKRNPFPLLVSSVYEAVGLSAFISAETRNLMDRFWPGGLTIVIQAQSALPDFLQSSTGTVAVRIPDHVVALALIRGLGHPLIGTSANLSGSEPALTPEGVRTQLGASLDLIIGEGACPGGVESTIVDMSGTKPILLRKGAVPFSDIQAELAMRQVR
jgi:L-threonylcarbamoyladenylate synthase